MRPPIALCLLAVVALVLPARAEKAPMSPKQLLETATHVVTARVVAIYEKTETKELWRYVRYVAEIVPETIEKGDGITKGAPIYVRYWTRRWAGPGPMPASTSGHRDLPGEGARVRVYLARNAYDGFSKENVDGGFNVIGANGFETL